MNTHPLFIDNVAFAKRDDQISGTLTLGDCKRLAEVLQSAEIRYELQGENNLGRFTLRLDIDAELQATCQRCLNPMPLNLHREFNYLINDAPLSEYELSDLEANDDVDLIEPSPAMDLIVLIEDELLMALPIAPTHDEDCSANIKEGVAQSGEKPNPFAVLKGLIKP
ncbi:MAG TPA: YceD family protein [Methylotenera sp.]|nr:YceD family protein [Methylotenera sp.]